MYVIEHKAQTGVQALPVQGVALMIAKVQRPASTDLDPRIAVTGQADYAAIAAASSSHCERFAQAQNKRRFTDVEGFVVQKRNTKHTTNKQPTKQQTW
jgi:hypothetical protein